MPLEKLCLLQPTLEHHWWDYNSPHTPRHIKLGRVTSIPVWNDKMTRQHAASGQVSVNSAFTWSWLLSKAYQFCNSNVWVLQHHSVHAFDMSTIRVFVHLGLQYKWNQLSWNNSSYTCCIHKGWVSCWEMTWPDDLQTRCSQYIGIPLDRLHWNHTGWCYLPVVYHWQSNVNFHNWNTMEDPGATSTLGAIGTTLADASTQFQWQSSVNLHNWNTLDHHWNTTRNTLGCHKITTGSG